jgi:hypothetical protein
MSPLSGDTRSAESARRITIGDAGAQAETTKDRDDKRRTRQEADTTKDGDDKDWDDKGAGDGRA